MSFQLIAPKSAAQRDSKSPMAFSSSRRDTSLDPPAYTTDDILAAKYRKHSKYWQWIRVGIAAVTLAISISIIACAASSLRGYSDTHLGSEWLLPLWPLSVDLRPTHAVLACGIVVAIADILYLAPALFPSVRDPQSPDSNLLLIRSYLQRSPKLRLLNIVSTVFSFICLSVTVFTTAFASTITSHLVNSADAGTLTSWTCKWQGFESIAPAGFPKICMESMVALDLVILLLILEVFTVVVSGWGWWVESRIKRGTSDSEGKMHSGSP